MGEILVYLIFFILGVLINVISTVPLIGLFFLICVGLRLITGFYFSGWLGSVLFLVFVGGILVIIFYLGLFGNYYKFKNYLLISFVLIMILTPKLFFSFNKKFNYGENSDFFFNPRFYILVGILLFLTLCATRKILNLGRALRRFC